MASILLAHTSITAGYFADKNHRLSPLGTMNVSHCLNSLSFEILELRLSLTDSGTEEQTEEF